MCVSVCVCGGGHLIYIVSPDRAVNIQSVFWRRRSRTLDLSCLGLTSNFFLPNRTRLHQSQNRLKSIYNTKRVIIRANPCISRAQNCINTLWYRTSMQKVNPYSTRRLVRISSVSLQNVLFKFK